jgi:hypothetical protein
LEGKPFSVEMLLDEPDNERGFLVALTTAKSVKSSGFIIVKENGNFG